MCHLEGIAEPTRGAWVDTRTGRLEKPPALLELTRQFEHGLGETGEEPIAVTTRMLTLLDTAIAQAGGDPRLERTRQEWANANPNDPGWRPMIARLAQDLRHRAMVLYGARITPVGPAGDYESPWPGVPEATRAYLAAPADSPQRERISTQIHTGVTVRPDGCADCHLNPSPRLDFRSVGYSPARAEALSNLPVAAMLHPVGQGRPFYLPTMREAGDEQ
jgi:hypothetical protein